MQYVKRAIPMQVLFADHAGSLHTLEGVVAYRTGDALVTGVEGERWPIAREDFERTYQPLFPTRMAEDGTYQKRHVPVHALQVTETTALSILNGTVQLHAAPGDWVVTDAHGKRWVVANSVFQKTYRVMES